jgi:CheY-like chemotaxis protein
MGPILIVDDEFGVLEVLRDFLQDEGYRTVIALNGRQALEHMALERPALVFLDYMLPLLNGAAVLTAMKQDPHLKDVPVVLMSASPQKSWQNLPATAFMPKPFGLEEFLGHVRRLVGDPQAR